MLSLRYMKLAKIVEVSVLRKKKTFKLTADDFFNGLFGRPNGMVKFVLLIFSDLLMP